MSQPVSRPPSSPEAARSDVPPALSADPRPAGFPEHEPSPPQAPPHSEIEREIERSERALAALAATRALARAAFTDSQLAADDAKAAEQAADEGDDDGWVRTEYVAFEHTFPPADDAPPRHLVGGSFDPGIASQQGRTFPGASMADASLKTRTGAQARFLHESRHAPRGEQGGAAASQVGAHQDRPAGHPGRPATASAPARSRTPAPARAPAREGLKFALAAGLGAVVVLAGGGMAWKAGWLSRGAASATTAATAPAEATTTAPPATTTATVAPTDAQAEAARILSPARQEITITPAAGVAPPRGEAQLLAGARVLEDILGLRGATPIDPRAGK